jgi:hypothetical protein
MTGRGLWKLSMPSAAKAASWLALCGTTKVVPSRYMPGAEGRQLVTDMGRSVLRPYKVVAG